MDRRYEEFTEIIKRSGNIVFFGGAGVSTESGIPDFRSTDGLYNQKYDYPPETILSHTFFVNRPEEFYRFYWDKMICTEAKPNITHKVLAELEEIGKLRAVVTQNIDGLHQMAGSKRVYELHGTVHKNLCTQCHRLYNLEEIKEARRSRSISETGKQESQGYVPLCECGGVIKPYVVLYEEGLDDLVMGYSIKAISEAEVLIVGGTSLSVYPAAGLIRYFRGNKLILINKSVTPFDKNADMVINAGLGEVFSELSDALNK